MHVARESVVLARGLAQRFSGAVQVNKATMPSLNAELQALIGNETLLDFFERAADGLWLWDLSEDGVSYVTPAFGRVFGYEPEEVTQEAAFWKELCHPGDWEMAMAAMQVAITNKEPYDVTLRMRHKDGTWRWSRSVGLILFDENGNPHRGFGIQYDMTELMEAKAQLEREVRRDPLTRLLNRRGINEALAQILDQVQRLHCEAYALLIDLDDFKHVNDTHGLSVGDFVLSTTAQCLTQAVRVVDAVGRVGGDEFIVFLLARNHAEAEIVAERVTDELRNQTIVYAGATIEITCSSALLPIYCADGARIDRLDTVLQAAAPYLQCSKHNGKDQTAMLTIRPSVAK